MLKIGITGGIGSGKTVVAQLFELLGVPVYYADSAAKKLMDSNPGVKEKLINHFGPETYAGGKLDRAYLAGVVFNNPAQLKLLNSIVHPVVINDSVEWMNSQKKPMVMKEAAIFFESGSQVEMDYMIGIYAPRELRITRVLKRDNSSRQSILDRISKQMDEEEKMKRCDFVIFNDEQQLLIPQVLQLHQYLLKILENNHQNNVIS